MFLYRCVAIVWCTNISSQIANSHELAHLDNRCTDNYDPTKRGSYLKYKMVPIEMLIGKRGKNQMSMRDVPIEKAGEYAAEDADITLQLKAPLLEKLKEIL